MFREAVTVAAGAALGASTRFAVDHLLGVGPVPLLAVNVLGSLLLGALRPGPFWGTGFLGGFTSFSTFAVLTADASPARAAGYAATTVLGCVGAWLLGDRWARGRSIQGRRAPRGR